jgi:ATP adenylyltransferase/5',5'''-P-1,P-4-tetraphosphate phosphorylase II
MTGTCKSGKNLVKTTQKNPGLHTIVLKIPSESDEDGNMLADCYNISNRLKNYFSQLLNVHNNSDIRQT